MPISRIFGLKIKRMKKSLIKSTDALFGMDMPIEVVRYYSDKVSIAVRGTPELMLSPEEAQKLIQAITPSNQGRRTGNTTRAVDQAVQELFTNGQVMLIDEAAPGTRKGQEHITKVFLTRMSWEHPRVDLITEMEGIHTVVKINA